MDELNDVLHYEKMLNLFNFDLLVGGEYPFYTDDRVLDNSETFKKKVYRNGKRRSVNVSPVSLTCLKGEQLAEDFSKKKHHIQNTKQFPNHFINFVVNNWEEHLTKQQKQFVLDVLAGNENLYSRQLRHKYRTNIQKRLKRAFIGSGGESVSIYRMGEFRLKLDLIKQFGSVADNNELFTKTIIKNLDREYVSEIVYERMSPEAQKNIVLCYQGKVPTIETIHLYKFFEIIESDREQFEVLGLE